MRNKISDNRGRFSVDLKTREQAAYEVLRQAVIAGRWQPGESLIISRIALDLGMSRIPVTNAVKQLANEGFVRVRPHQEAVVAPLDPMEIREIYLMRASLESLALEEATAKVTEQDLAEVRAINDELRRVASSGLSTIDDIRAIDKSFHERMRDIAGLPGLSKTLKNYADQCEYYRVCLLDQHHFAPPSAERHEPIIAALESRDAASLRTHMTAHTLHGMDLILDALGDSR